MAQFGNSDVISQLPETKRNRLESLLETGRGFGSSPPSRLTPQRPNLSPTDPPNVVRMEVDQGAVTEGFAQVISITDSSDMNDNTLSTTRQLTGRADANTPSTLEVIHVSASNGSFSNQNGADWSRSRAEGGDGEYSLEGEDKKLKRARVDPDQGNDAEVKGPVQKPLDSFFKPRGDSSKPGRGQSRAASTGPTPVTVTPSTSSSAGSSSTAGGISNHELKKAVDLLKEAKKNAEYSLESKCRELEALRLAKSAVEDKNSLLRKKLEETHRSMAREAARRSRDRLAADSVRLGKFSVMRVGDTVGEVFEKGYAFHELQIQKEELLKRKEELEARKQELSRQKRMSSRRKSSQSNISAILDDDNIDVEIDFELVAEQYAVSMHSERLKKEELAFAEKEKLLDAERGSHEKELRRVQCEDKSKYYRDLPLLGDGRYSLLRLLGQGGFSEVWLALDLDTLQEVAVKIHQLNSQWAEERQRAFIRHAKRELEIHRAISHPRVVKLLGYIEINNEAFATILEYCRGIDLDEVLKKNKNGLPEKESKPILMQILSGLRYFSTVSIDNVKKNIIHYDLKPANILFDEMGDVKITDFGLSKVVDGEEQGTSIDQTSPGAGTYWYLPPECFTKDRISSKVDVWSVGVIYYQMLYGRRPFGEGMSQHAIYKDGVILNARQVEFPLSTDPKANKVSEEAKDFIRGCLTYDQDLRWDIGQMCSSSYVRSR